MWQKPVTISASLSLTRSRPFPLPLSLRFDKLILKKPIWWPSISSRTPGYNGGRFAAFLLFNDSDKARSVVCALARKTGSIGPIEIPPVLESIGVRRNCISLTVLTYKPSQELMWGTKLNALETASGYNHPSFCTSEFSFHFNRSRRRRRRHALLTSFTLLAH